MLKQRSSPKGQTGKVSRVDQLLPVLRAALRHDPPAELRGRLAQMSIARLGGDPPERTSRTSLLCRPTFTVWAVELIAAILIAGAALIIFVTHEEGHGGKGNRIAREEPMAVPPTSATRNAASPPLVAKPHHRNWVPHSENDNTRRAGDLVIPLPYSDSAVHTGTGTMIRVSLSQDELLSLGVSLNPTVDDRRFMAEMILGDDGLPRAISLPLPLTALEARK